MPWAANLLESWSGKICLQLQISWKSTWFLLTLGCTFRHVPAHFGPLNSGCLTGRDQSSFSDVDDDDDCPIIRCDISIPKTPFMEVRQKRVPELPEAFIYDRAAATSGIIENFSSYAFRSLRRRLYNKFLCRIVNTSQAIMHSNLLPITYLSFLCFGLSGDDVIKHFCVE